MSAEDQAPEASSLLAAITAQEGLHAQEHRSLIGAESNGGERMQWLTVNGAVGKLRVNPPLRRTHPFVQWCPRPGGILTSNSNGTAS